jgi:thioredoxin-related protein
MDKTTFQDKEMIDYLNKKFYCVKMDGEDKNIITFKGKEFSFVNKGRRGYNELPAALLKGKLSYPTFVYLDEDLRILLVMPGYRGPAEMLTIVSYLGSNKYKDMKWEAYINETKGEK